MKVLKSCTIFKIVSFIGDSSLFPFAACFIFITVILQLLQLGFGLRIFHIIQFRTSLANSRKLAVAHFGICLDTLVHNMVDNLDIIAPE